MACDSIVKEDELILNQPLPVSLFEQERMFITKYEEKTLSTLFRETVAKEIEVAKELAIAYQNRDAKLEYSFNKHPTVDVFLLV